MPLHSCTQVVQFTQPSQRPQQGDGMRCRILSRSETSPNLAALPYHLHSSLSSSALLEDAAHRAPRLPSRGHSYDERLYRSVSLPTAHSPALAGAKRKWDSDMAEWAGGINDLDLLIDAPLDIFLEDTMHHSSSAVTVPQMTVSPLQPRNLSCDREVVPQLSPTSVLSLHAASVSSDGTANSGGGHGYGGSWEPLSLSCAFDESDSHSSEPCSPGVPHDTPDVSTTTQDVLV